MVNATDHVIRTRELGGLDVPPGAQCEIEDGYCDARPAMNGTRIPSIVERLASGLVPADMGLRAKWGKHLRLTEPPAPTQEQEAERLADEGIPPAVTAMVKAGEVDSPKKRRKA